MGYRNNIYKHLNHVMLNAAFLYAILMVGCTFLYADDTSAYEFRGKPVSEVIDHFTRTGIQVFYSSKLVKPSMKIEVEPEASQPIEMLEAILQPHGLVIHSYDDIHVVAKGSNSLAAGDEAELFVIVRNAPSTLSEEDYIVSTQPAYTKSVHYGPGAFSLYLPGPGAYSFQFKERNSARVSKSVKVGIGETTLIFVDLVPGQVSQEHIVVTASRYVLFSTSQFYIDQQAIQAQPKLGEDPIRSAHRLPGVASDGYSSKSYFRGGLKNESSIYLNGFKLTDPFHIRDFHSMFSLIDAHAVSGIKVYTGGFPADFGDDASGILLLESKSPEKPLQTRLGVSVFNTSLFNSGRSEGGKFDWLVSARRSNLEDVLTDDVGEPKYSDVFATLGYYPTTGTRVTFNALIANDDVEVVTENDPEEPERSNSDTDNDAMWFGIEKAWSPDLESTTVLSAKRFSNRRVAMVHDPEEMIADVEDYRTVDHLGFTHSMAFQGLENHSLRWGMEFSHQEAKYDYKGTAEYYGFAADFPGLENPKLYQIESRPTGNAIGFYVADQLQISSHQFLDLGLRWDKQTYTEPGYSGQLSPRVSLLHRTERGNEFRLSIGRFYQSERIYELQVENNVDSFYKPKRVDQYIASYQWKLHQDYQFRAEAFYKDYSREIPRSENLFDSLQMVPEFQPDRVRLEPDSARAAGFEFSVDYIGSESFSWYLSYALTKAVDLIDGKSELRSWDQRHAFQAGLAWQSNGWEVGAAIRAHTGWPTTDLMLGYDPISEQYHPVPGPRNDERFNMFASLDFRVSKSIELTRGDFSVFLEVLNATNRGNQCCVDYGIEQAPDGSHVLERKVEEWLPLIPSIGLVWSF